MHFRMGCSPTLSSEKSDSKGEGVEEVDDSRDFPPPVASVANGESSVNKSCVDEDMIAELFHLHPKIAKR